MNIKLAISAVALLLTACTPSLNLEVAIPRPSSVGFSVVLEADATTGAAPLPVVFTASTPESATYAWYVNDRKLGVRRSTLKHTFREAGSYEVTVAATNAAGEADTASLQVEVAGPEVTVEEL